MIYKLLLLIIAIFVASCSKPEPNPELRDPIYQDYVTQKGLAEKDLSDAIGKMNGYKDEMKKSEPQTGQYKRNQIKYFEFEDRVAILKQQVKFWEIKIEERLIEDRLSYNAAYKEKKPWPNKEENEKYLSAKKLRAAKLQWDQKERIKGMKMGSAPAAKGAGHEEAPPAHGE